LFVHTAIFTNLTRDHLDFHSTMERYFEAKCQMFAPVAVAPPPAAVINRDDEWGRRIPIAAGTQIYWYGLRPMPSIGRRTSATIFRVCGLRCARLVAR